MSTPREFCLELRKKFSVAPIYGDGDIWDAWQRCVADGSADRMDDEPHVAQREFHSHLAEAMLARIEKESKS